MQSMLRVEQGGEGFEESGELGALDATSTSYLEHDMEQWNFSAHDRMLMQ